MAKFIYRMQNILNIKYKLEESAKQEYAEARQALAAEEQKLDALRAKNWNLPDRRWHARCRNGKCMRS